MSTGVPGGPGGVAANGGIGNGGPGGGNAGANANGGINGAMSGPAVCGNGMIEMGEKCDPAATCPTVEQCRTADKCLTPRLRGDPAMCNVACELVMASECTAGDGCCPPGCTPATDTDCSASCGDGEVGAGETCEPTSPTMPCPEACDDQNPCTEDRKTGTAAQCNVVCTNTPITQPTSGDQCCPPGADATNDTDCKPVCGNHVVEPGEQCDGDCPSTCDDDDSCTADTMMGNAQACTASCMHTMITAAAPGDGCCPAGANAENDSDCNAKCGNGVKEGSEKCDGADCPQSCDDGDDCTMDMMMGSAAACSAVCSHKAITNPAGGDGCCPARANANNDSDCKPKCGNGVKEEGETCDGSNCQMNCDDGNKCTNDRPTGSASSCNAGCTHDAIIPCCGDGRMDFPETCDGTASCNAVPCPDNQGECSGPKKVGNASSCDVRCTYVPRACCGNNKPDPGETCDGATCTNFTCPVKKCMSARVTGKADDCNLACAYDPAPCCGNGTLDPGETCEGATCLSYAKDHCDDGNICTNDLVTGDYDKCNIQCGEHARYGSGSMNICGGCNRLTNSTSLGAECQPPGSPAGCETGGRWKCKDTEEIACLSEDPGC